MEIKMEKNEKGTTVTSTRWEGPGCGWVILVFVAGKVVIEIIEAWSKAHGH